MKCVKLTAYLTCVIIFTPNFKEGIIYFFYEECALFILSTELCFACCA